MFDLSFMVVFFVLIILRSIVCAYSVSGFACTTPAPVGYHEPPWM